MVEKVKHSFSNHQVINKFSAFTNFFFFFFILKQLKSGWTVVEKDSLLGFTPFYFDYMAKGNSTILTKIFGFYSISISKQNKGKRSIKGKNVMNLDVLVMENLFSTLDSSQVFTGIVLTS